VNRLSLLVVAALWLATGAVTLTVPIDGYERTPGLAAMGPFNAHFARDVALAFLGERGGHAVGRRQAEAGGGADRIAGRFCTLCSTCRFGVIAASLSTESSPSTLRP
jgi:hypothetical protein